MAEEEEEKIEHEVKEGFFANWFKKLVYEEYKLTIWFVAEKVIDLNGNEIYTREPKHYKAVKFYSLKPTFIKFKDDADQLIEIKTAEPMNWDLVKVY